MNRVEQKNRLGRIIVAVVISFLLIGGCASPKLEKQDPFFDEWKTKAETSKGYSPGKPKPKGAQPAIIKPKVTPREIKIDEAEEKPLPKRKISLKMTDIDVSVVLRALARASDQNIIVSEAVAGKININITQAPWDQVFLG
ncbi:MAG: hypothetical protein PVF29_17560, partial [Desulfobacterales bacterium]